MNVAHEPGSNPAKRPSSPLRALPWWALLADALTLILVCLLCWVMLVGSINVELLGIRLIVRSLPRLLQILLFVLVMRHWLLPRPSLRDWAHHLAVAAALRMRRSTPALADVLPIVAATRLPVLLVGYLAVITFGYPAGAPAFRMTLQELHNLPARWDVGWYLGIVVRGYRWGSLPDQTNVAFFPGYPMVVRAVGLFQLDTSTTVAAAWIGVGVSIVAFLGALVYLHRLARELGFGAADARAVAWLLATYPFAVFYSVPYSESLFLLATVAACYHQRRRQAPSAGAWALVAGLTRPNGLLLAAPLGLMALTSLWQWRGVRVEGRSSLRDVLARSGPQLLAALMPAAGVLLYCGVNWWHTGQPLYWLTAQGTGWGRALSGTDTFVKDLRQIAQLGLPAFMERRPADTLNLLATLLGLVSIWPIVTRIGLPFAVLVALNLTVPLSYGGLLSMGRFTSVLFPMFLWMSVALHPRLRVGLICAFAMLQAVCASLFFTWRPVF